MLVEEDLRIKERSLQQEIFLRCVLDYERDVKEIPKKLIRDKNESLLEGESIGYTHHSFISFYSSSFYSLSNSLLCSSQYSLC